MDFDYWKDLFEKDPEEFDRQRKEFIDQQIDKDFGKDPERAMAMKRMMWRHNAELDRIKDPVARYNKVVELFWEQTQTMQAALNEFTEMFGGPERGGD